MNFSEESSIHGIKYILSLNNRRVARVFWAVALLSSLCGFFYYMYYAYVKWQLEPELVMRSKERNSTDFPAPAITLCLNVFAKSDSANVIKILQKVTEDKRNNLTNPITEIECQILVSNLHWCSPFNFRFSPATIDRLCPNFDQENLNVIDVMDQSALETYDFMLLCSTRKNNDCGKSFSKIFTDFGMCHTYNMMSSGMIFNMDTIHDDFKKIKTEYTNENEPSWSPEMNFRSEFIDYPSKAKRGDLVKSFIGLDDIDMENICNSKNFIIFIHKPNEIITPFHDAIYLNYDEQINLKIKPHSYKHDDALKAFSPDVKKCYFESERKLKFFKTYTKALCQWECEANETLKMCGCVKFSMPRDKFTKICNYSMVACMVKINQPSCQCYGSCVDVAYTYKMNKLPLSSRLGMMFTNQNFSFALSMIVATIDSEYVEEIENYVSYKLQNFISDFGGLLGLFMGCSLLSVVEIFYFIITYWIEFLQRDKKKINVKGKKTEENSKDNFNALLNLIEDEKIKVDRIEKKLLEVNDVLNDLCKVTQQLDLKLNIVEQKHCQMKVEEL